MALFYRLLLLKELHAPPFISFAGIYFINIFRTKQRNTIFTIRLHRKMKAVDPVIVGPLNRLYLLIKLKMSK